MNKCDVSVIVRTLDRPALLRRALASVFEQKSAPVELVVVNLGDKMSELDLKSAAGVRVELICPGRLSRGAALNAGLRVTTAKWYAVLDDDDTWSPDFLSRMVAAIANGAVGGVACRAEIVEERITPEGRVEERSRRVFNGDFEAVSLPEMAAANQFTINAALLRRDLWESLGGYREDLAALEDWEFNLRYLVRAPIGALPDVLARYHRRAVPRGSSEANSEAAVHVAAKRRLVDEWLREDLAAGRYGLGALALAAENRADLGRITRFLNRIKRLARWWRSGGA